MFAGGSSLQVRPSRQGQTRHAGGVPSGVLVADRMAAALAAARERVALPLARAARAFLDQKGWFALGFARLEDHARERLGRSGRWLRDLAALGAALDRMPCLGDALTGRDGGRPIGRVAALIVSRVSSPESVAAWIALAREVSVRELRSSGRSREADLRRVRLPVPGPVRVAFDEATDLFRAISGRETSVAAFVEALVAEWLSGDAALADEATPILPGPGLDAVERALARATENWRELASTSSLDEDLAGAAATLAKLEDLSARAGTGGPADLERQLREMVALEEAIERQLGEILAALSERGAWRWLSFSGAGHYGEQRLGVSRTTAENRAILARDLRRLPAVHEAYEAGRIGLEAALLVRRVLDRGPRDPAVESAWVSRAEEATIKRLRDEARAVARRRVAGPRVAVPPLEDSAWHGSLRRERGTALERILDLGSAAAGGAGTDVFLSLRLPAELAGDLLTAIESARLATGEREQDQRPSTLAARTFSTDGRGVPAWIGLLALLEEFALVWDDPRQAPRRASEAVYARAGWRCEAPGCVSRKGLEDHHVVYRSHGGTDALTNRVCLCRFHHQVGEHGGHARCRGIAPLGVTWTLGRNGAGGVYRNELRL